MLNWLIPFTELLGFCSYSNISVDITVNKNVLKAFLNIQQLF